MIKVQSMANLSRKIPISCDIQRTYEKTWTAQIFGYQMALIVKTDNSIVPKNKTKLTLVHE